MQYQLDSLPTFPRKTNNQRKKTRNFRKTTQQCCSWYYSFRCRQERNKKYTEPNFTWNTVHKKNENLLILWGFFKRKQTDVRRV